ncbi:MAG: RNA polymerase sigma factor [Thermoanaerobaculia bacterium]
MGALVPLMKDFEQRPEVDDRELVAAIRAGEADGFETLVRRKTPKVYGICYRVLGNQEDAKDVAQLAFVRIWENLEKYDASWAFDTWMYRIVTNVAIDWLRTRQSRDSAVNSSLRLVRTSQDAEQGVSLQNKEIERVFEDVSSVLSPKQKTIFVMREMEDLSSAEISRVLGCRESTVRNHLFNARKLMQQELRRRYPEYAKLWETRSTS